MIIQNVALLFKSINIHCIMKRVYLIFILVFLSQINYAQRFGGGFLAGLSMTQVDGDSWGGFNKAGFTGGIYTYTGLNKNMDIQLEFRYVQKGSQSDSEIPEEYYRLTLNYIEIPLFIKYHIYSKISADIGIAFGYLQESTENDGYGELPSEPEFNKTELSGLIGLEYILWKRLKFNARYNYSILPVREHPGEQTWYLNKGQYNSVLTFTFYYQLANLGRK
ncbi:MAG: hypothetical protein A2X13_07715 [Bacteroidetes bacterium GWC2_33_15]|nr:MAG: hypothetical protein A2X10_04770 [Bacteroidetes bacterium GWA2_33_15]OFX52640.1 MAG: hypothetical protein A2X13_07715 [Bacteroidetes bacterium GWC2_33_15]OFX64054.1 MAG: hypothetical protein A2X15_02620 [Bacteroidetes bacterium GWB2_32_14]OFX67260.1 MAG: hypothetical protein A2X14_11795 [Bacteroidetes bacterium GWD2_33_33]HAN18882.1 hypothetical protein [Bacteroidales bacterium]